MKKTWFHWIRIRIGIGSNNYGDLDDRQMINLRSLSAALDSYETDAIFFIIILYFYLRPPLFHFHSQSPSSLSLSFCLSIFLFPYHPYIPLPLFPQILSHFIKLQALLWNWLSRRASPWISFPWKIFRLWILSSKQMWWIFGATKTGSFQ